jgi:recombinational DNA repair protein (RecF pathway)
MRPGLGNPPLYRAGVTTLRALATSGTDALAAWVLFFEARAIAATGHRPALETCAGCGQPVPGAAAFSPAAGGLVHPACAPSGPRCRLSPRAREALERLYTERLPALAAEPLGPAALREARTVHDLLLPHLLERRLVAMALLGPVGDGGIRGPGRGRG